MEQDQPLIYPSWRYHPDGRSLIVNDPTEDESLGEGWSQLPVPKTLPSPEEMTAENAVLRSENAALGAENAQLKQQLAEFSKRRK